MKEKEFVTPIPNVENRYVAVIYDAENPSPEVYMGTGKTVDEALRIAKERYEKVLEKRRGE